MQKVLHKRLDRALELQRRATDRAQGTAERAELLLQVPAAQLTEARLHRWMRAVVVELGRVLGQSAHEAAGPCVCLLGAVSISTARSRRMAETACRMIRAVA